MELHLSIEAEAAGLAAERRTAGQLKEIGRRLDDVNQAFERGESAVDASFVSAEEHKVYLERLEREHVSIYDTIAARSPVYRPRLVGHRTGPYAARAAAESCSALTAAGGLKPCRSTSQVAL
jgi:hypothetical protein